MILHTRLNSLVSLKLLSTVFVKNTHIPKKVGNTHLQLGVQNCKVSMFFLFLDKLTSNQ